MAERLTAHLLLRDEGGADPARALEGLGAELSALLRADPLATVPPHLFLLGRVLGLLAGVSAQLGTRANLAKALLPELFAAGPAPG